MGHHALGVDPRQALTGSRKSAGQSHLYVTRSKERLPAALAGAFLCAQGSSILHPVKKATVRAMTDAPSQTYAQGIIDAAQGIVFNLSEPLPSDPSLRWCDGRRALRGVVTLAFGTEITRAFELISIFAGALSAGFNLRPFRMILESGFSSSR